MQPKIINANRLFSFDLSERYRAAYFNEVESEGIMQYHFVLVVMEKYAPPSLFICSEWYEPAHKSEPVFGAFSENGHTNYGSAVTWSDDLLFLLEAIRKTREILQLPEGPLCEGEAAGLTGILKRLNDKSCPVPDELAAAYRSEITRNDARIAAYMKTA